MHEKMDCDLGDENILMSEPLSSFQDQVDRIYVSGNNNVVNINITMSKPAEVLKETNNSIKPLQSHISKPAEVVKEEIKRPQSPKVLSAQEQRARALKWAEAEFGWKSNQKKKKANT
jgi:hypothetical protein